MDNLQIIVHNNERVLTTARLADQYGTSQRAIKQNFNNNKDRYVEGKHFYKLNGRELKAFKNKVENFDLVDKNASALYLWTEKGALLHAKSLNTDKAWQVYEFLVDHYFRSKEQLPKVPEYEQLTLETIEYHYFDKTLNGVPVISLADFEHFTGINSSTALYTIKRYLTLGKDYFALNGMELRRFKIENPNVRRTCNHMTVITKSGVEKLVRLFGTTAEMPPMITEKKREVVPVEEVGVKDEPPTAPEPRKVTRDECIAALNVLQYIKFKHKRWITECAESGEPDDGSIAKGIKRIDSALDEVGFLFTTIR